MRNFDLNTMSMADAVLEVLEANSDKLDQAPKLPVLRQELREKVTACKAKNQLLALPSGSTELKQGNRGLIEKAADVLVNTLLLYANQETKPEVASKVNNLRYNDIYRSSGEKLAETLGELIKLATDLLPNLADYHLKAARLTEFQQNLDSFKAMQAAPRGDISLRSAIRTQVEAMVAEIRSLLNDRMDRSVNLIEDELPEFFAAYYNARVIVDRHGKHRKGKQADETKGTVNGTVLDDATGDPLVNVLVRREGLVEAVTTDIHGVFVFVDHEPGKYKFICKKDTYSELDFNEVEVTAGEETQLTGRMKKA